jgi:ABC-type polysaccharide/polyol phosphate transport system ATPase subunit
LTQNISSEVALETKKLSKVFCKSKKNLILNKILSRSVEGFSALESVSVRICKGSCFGILGLNGSGKSTFLQLIAGILQPTKGEVIVNGRLSAIFELGSGFNLDFTGRENISLYASIVGLTEYLTKNIEEEILNFAEIGDFIDQPLSTYSSGMIARLGFSIRAFLKFDILILDEVLAVGDIYFQRKCIRLLERFKNEGKVIIFISHNIDQILELCDEAMVLDNGKVCFLGDPKKCAYHYYEIVNAMSAESFTKQDNFDEIDEYRPNYGKGRCSLKSFYCSGAKIKSNLLLQSLKDYEFMLLVNIKENLTGLEIALNLRTTEGTIISGRHFALGNHCKGDELKIRVHFKNMLNKGDYFLSCGITSEEKSTRIFENRYLDFVHITVPVCHQTVLSRFTGSFVMFDDIQLVDSVSN